MQSPPLGIRAVAALAWLVALGAGGCSPPEVVWPETAFEASAPAALRVGAATEKITRQRGVYLAGGIPYRPALRVHDDLWARALVLDDGAHRVALVALDLIGLYYDDVVRIRRQIAQRLAVDYVLVACTHIHNGPDLLGYSAPRILPNDGAYKGRITGAVCDAVVQAAAQARPARLRIAVGDSGHPPLTHDTRPPVFIDDTLTTWQALDADNGQVLATVVHYASHPILISSLNFDVSSDFVYFLRTALESGMEGDDGPVDGFGGICLFFNGAIGGRITPARAEPLTVGRTPERDYQRPQAYGYRLARRVQELLRESGETVDGPLPLAAAARPVRVPLASRLMLAATRARVFARAIEGDSVNSEAAIIRIGPLELFAVPGLIFPELVRGGFGALPGSDFPDAQPEQPVLAELAWQRYFVVVGLANDMLGDVVPRLLWDERPPYTSPDGTKPYGEIISPGPQVAQVLLEAFAALRGR